MITKICKAILYSQMENNVLLNTFFFLPPPTNLSSITQSIIPSSSLTHIPYSYSHPYTSVDIATTKKKVHLIYPSLYLHIYLRSLYIYYSFSPTNPIPSPPIPFPQYPNPPNTTAKDHNLIPPQDYQDYQR